MISTLIKSGAGVCKSQESRNTECSCTSEMCSRDTQCLHCPCSDLYCLAPGTAVRHFNSVCQYLYENIINIYLFFQLWSFFGPHSHHGTCKIKIYVDIKVVLTVGNTGPRIKTNLTWQLCQKDTPAQCKNDKGCRIHPAVLIAHRHGNADMN